MTAKPKRRTLSIVLFVLAVLAIVLGLAFGAATNQAAYVLLGLALAIGGVIFYRRGK